MQLEIDYNERIGIIDNTFKTNLSIENFDYTAYFENKKYEPYTSNYDNTIIIWRIWKNMNYNEKMDYLKQTAKGV